MAADTVVQEDVKSVSWLLTNLVLVLDAWYCYAIYDEKKNPRKLGLQLFAHSYHVQTETEANNPTMHKCVVSRMWILKAEYLASFLLFPKYSYP